MALVKGMTKVPGKFKKKWGKERYYNEGFFGRLKEASKFDNRVWKIKMSDRSDNMLDYHKFQPKEKISDYVWETEQFLKFANEFKVTSPLIERLKVQIKEYHSLLEK